jgi:hypothetical protein
MPQSEGLWLFPDAIGAALMLAGALCEAKIGVEAAGRSLESV